MLRKSFIGIFWMLAANVLIKPFWILGVDRLVQNELGTAQYGSYYTLFGILSMLAAILDLGVNSFLTKSLANSNFNVRQLWTQLLKTKLLLVLLFLIASAAVGFALNFFSDLGWLFSCVALNFVLSAMLLFGRAYLSGSLKFNTDAFFSVFDRIIAICIFLSLFLAQSDLVANQLLWLFVLSQTTGLVVSNVMVYGLAFSHSAAVKVQASVASFTPIEVLKRTWPFALYGLMMYLYSRVDVLFITLLRDDAAFQNGIYAQGYRIVEAVTAFTFLFGAILLPAFGNLFKQSKSIQSLLNGSELLLIAPLTLVFALVPFYSNHLNQMLYHESSPFAIHTFEILVFYGYFFAFNYLYGAALTADGQMRTLNQMAGGGIAINLLLNLWLVPIYGALGAAIASFFAQSTVAALLVWRVYSQYGHWRILATRAMALVALVVVVLGIRYLSALWLAVWYWQVAVSLGAGLILLAVFRFKTLIGFWTILKSSQ